MVEVTNSINVLSRKQLAANRWNAQRSTGPRTGEGKKTPALNARRHNLTGQVTAMTDADLFVFIRCARRSLADLVR